MTAFFANYIQIFYMVWFIAALSLAISADLWRSAIFLSLLYVCAWIPGIWFNAPVHMLANFVIFVLMVITYTTRLGWLLAVLTCAMMLTNGYFTLAEGSEFWRLSIINLLFLLQCLITIGLSYNAHRTRKRKPGNDDGLFMAKISESQ